MDKVLLDWMFPLRATFVTLRFEGSLIYLFFVRSYLLLDGIGYLVKIDQ